MKIVINVIRIVLLVVICILSLTFLICGVDYLINTSAERVDTELLTHLIINIGITLAIWFIFQLAYQSIEGLER